MRKARYTCLTSAPLANWFGFYPIVDNFSDSKVYGANMGPTCGRQDPGGPHVGLMKRVIWVITSIIKCGMKFYVNF